MGNDRTISKIEFDQLLQGSRDAVARMNAAFANFQKIVAEGLHTDNDVHLHLLCEIFSQDDSREFNAGVFHTMGRALPILRQFPIVPRPKIIERTVALEMKYKKEWHGHAASRALSDKLRDVAVIIEKLRVLYRYDDEFAGIIKSCMEATVALVDAQYPPAIITLHGMLVDHFSGGNKYDE